MNSQTLIYIFLKEENKTSFSTLMCPLQKKCFFFVYQSFVFVSILSYKVRSRERFRSYAQNMIIIINFGRRIQKQKKNMSCAKRLNGK